MLKWFSKILYRFLELTEEVEHHGGPKNDIFADRLGALNLKVG